MEPATTLQLKPRPFRTLFGVLFMAVLTVLLSRLLPEEKSPGWFFAGFFVALSALGMLVFVVNLLPGSSYLELTPAGMTVRSLYQDAFFAWADIRGFFTEGTYLGRQVHWKFVDCYRAWNSTRNLATRFTGFKATLPDTYGYRADGLIALLDEWRLKAAPAPVTPATQEQPLPANYRVEGKTMIITLDPQTAQARHRRGVELTTAGRLEEALAELEAAQKLDPFSCDIQLDKAIALRSLGRFSEALEVCDAAMNMLVIPPATLALFHQLRADVLQEQGQPEQLQSVVQYQEANALLESGQPERALPLFEAATRALPQFYEAFHGQGLALGHLDRHEEALVAFAAALRINPTFDQAHDNRDAALYNLRRFDEQLETYEALLAEHPDYAHGWYRLGILLDSFGEHQEAAEAFARAIALRPEMATYHLSRGIALDRSGQPERALEALNEALRLNPDSVNAQKSWPYVTDRLVKP